jgi:hypothetical protein
MPAMFLFKFCLLVSLFSVRQQALLSVWHGKLPCHSTILPHTSRRSMRLLRSLPQLRQNLSNHCDLYLASVRVLQPLPELAFAKPPLPPDFDCGDFLALRPQTNGSRRYAQPFRHSRRCEKWFVIG